MKRVRSSLVVALIAALFVLSFPSGPSVRAQAPAADTASMAEKLRRIEEFVGRRMKADGSVGLTVGFVLDDLVWVKGFGLADLENGVPAKRESSYRMASVTKPMTAVAVLKLVEEGKIDLDAEVQRYVPYFPKKEHPVTVRLLLSHLGGISHYRNYDLEGHFKEPKNTREAIAVFADFDLVAEPGTRYNYSSYGYNLLGAVIEGASGKSYGEYMTENVWRPLGMNETRLDDPVEIIPHRVEGYRMIDGRIRNSEYVDISSRFAAGGIRSTVPDMLAFGRGMYEGRILSAETRAEMWTGRATRAGRSIGYGYGWSTDNGNGRFIVGHGGAQAETRTDLLVVPNRRFAIAVASNFEGTDTFAYVRKIFETVLGEPWRIRVYTGDPEDRAVLHWLDQVFVRGMRRHDRFGRPVTTDPAELRPAFAYFNSVLKAVGEERFEDVFGRLARPDAEELLVRQVSYMAGELRRSGKEPDEYYKRGAIAFFKDYADLSRSRADHPADLRFDAGFEKRIDGWSADWERTWTDHTRGLEIGAATDLKAVETRLGRLFKNASVYPDYTGEFADLVREHIVSRRMEEALAAGRTAVGLYPDSGRMNANLGILHVIADETDQARSYFRRSLELDASGASAGYLNSVAYDLAAAGQPLAGLRLLHAAVELHPKVANLYDSIGEFYLRGGDRNKALEFYQKALETDPGYPNARVARETIERLKAGN